MKSICYKVFIIENCIWFTIFSLFKFVYTVTFSLSMLQQSTDRYVYTIRLTINVELHDECSDCATMNTTEKNYTDDTDVIVLF